MQDKIHIQKLRIGQNFGNMQILKFLLTKPRFAWNEAWKQIYISNSVQFQNLPCVYWKFIFKKLFLNCISAWVPQSLGRDMLTLRALAQEWVSDAYPFLPERSVDLKTELLTDIDKIPMNLKVYPF